MRHKAEHLDPSEIIGDVGDGVRQQPLGFASISLIADALTSFGQTVFKRPAVMSWQSRRARVERTRLCSTAFIQNGSSEFPT